MSTHRRRGRATLPRRLLASVASLVVVSFGLAGGGVLAVAGPAAAAEAITRPAVVSADDGQWRVVTTVDQSVRATSTAFDPAEVADQQLSLLPSIAGAIASIEADGSVLYQPALGWSGWDPVQILNHGTHLGGEFNVIVNAANGLKNTTTDGAASAAVQAGKDVRASINLDPAAGDLPGNDLSAGISYVITTATNPHAGVGFDAATSVLSYWLSAANTAGWDGDVVTYTVYDHDGNAATGAITIAATQGPLVLSSMQDTYPPLAVIPVNSGPVLLDPLANDSNTGAATEATVFMAHFFSAFSGGFDGDHEDAFTSAGTKISFTPPTDFEGSIELGYTVRDADGLDIHDGQALVIVGTPPITYEDEGEAPESEGGFPASRVNYIRIVDGVETVIDPLINDDIPSGVAELRVVTIPAGWTATVTDDFKLAVTAQSGGSDETIRYQVRDLTGRWSGLERIAPFVDQAGTFPVVLNEFTWAGTAITFDPRAGNEDVLTARGTTSLEPIDPQMTRPGVLTNNSDGTWTWAPTAGFTGDVQVYWSGTDGDGWVVSTIHVLGPQVDNWSVSFPSGGSGKVDNLLTGALWGSYADLITYIDGWVTSEPGRSRTAEGEITASSWDPPSWGWSPMGLAVDPPTDLDWPDSTLAANLADPFDLSTFDGTVSIGSPSSMLLASGMPQIAMRTYAGVTSDMVQGPTGEVAITVTGDVVTPPPPNPPVLRPTANPDLGRVVLGESASVSTVVLANDYSPNGTSSVAVTSDPEHGTAVLDPTSLTRSIIYTPDSSWTTGGTDVYSYTLTDSLGFTATATVTITSVPEKPLAVDDEGAIAAGGFTVNVSVLANDVLPNPAASVTVTAPTNGTVVVGADLTVTYTAGSAYTPADQFTYTVTDEAGLSSTATVRIAIVAVEVVVSPPVVIPPAVVTRTTVTVAG